MWDVRASTPAAVGQGTGYFSLKYFAKATKQKSSWRRDLADLHLRMTGGVCAWSLMRRVWPGHTDIGCHQSVGKGSPFSDAVFWRVTCELLMYVYIAILCVCYVRVSKSIWISSYNIYHTLKPFILTVFTKPKMTHLHATPPHPHTPNMQAVHVGRQELFGNGGYKGYWCWHCECTHVCMYILNLLIRSCEDSQCQHQCPISAMYICSYLMKPSRSQVTHVYAHNTSAHAHIHTHMLRCTHAYASIGGRIGKAWCECVYVCTVI